MGVPAGSLGVRLRGVSSRVRVPMHRHRSEHQVSRLPSSSLHTSKHQGKSLGRYWTRPAFWNVATMKDSGYFVSDTAVVGEGSVCTYTLGRHTVAIDRSKTSIIDQAY